MQDHGSNVSKFNLTDDNASRYAQMRYVGDTDSAEIGLAAFLGGATGILNITYAKFNEDAIDFVTRSLKKPITIRRVDDDELSEYFSA